LAGVVPTEAAVDYIQSPDVCSLKGCREGKASLLGEGVLGYAVSEEEELFIESRL